MSNLFVGGDVLLLPLLGITGQIRRREEHKGKEEEGGCEEQGENQRSSPQIKAAHFQAKQDNLTHAKHTNIASNLALATADAQEVARGKRFEPKDFRLHVGS